MTETFEHSVRPGSTALSVLSFVGLGVLAAFLWQVAPSFVLLMAIPALIACIWQVMSLPKYGIRITASTWQLLGIEDDFVVPTSQISYLRIQKRDGAPLVGLMLTDGTEIRLPTEFLPDLKQLAREATARNVKVQGLA
ncbi:hypothetical protein [Gymnodinialimonas hymeniacidonis]|uniref:hypothetical protein n=1 Tax=Gymnodinialimonas hymeniacidonis TaxID=3126508 RepID=UPI0034C5D5C2